MTTWKINGREFPSDALLSAEAGRLPPHRAVRTPKGTWVFLRGHSYFVEAVRAARARAGDIASAGDGTIVSPMPGKIFKLLVKKGDAVKTGQELVVLEAMKMEHAMRSPCDGNITELKIAVGELVEAGQVLAIVGT